MTGGVINGYIVYKSILPSYTVDIFCVVVVYGTTIFWISRALVSQIEKSKYAKSPLNPDLQRQKLLKLREIMATQKPYKSQEFSLSHLARLANLSTHHASQVINSGSGMSFNEFVNLYRVEEARNILQSSVGNQVKIETLAYELGYKSKSAFFNSFKKYTETTPARFRELIVK
jgi:AraC-like DNA-binding protein